MIKISPFEHEQIIKLSKYYPYSVRRLKKTILMMGVREKSMATLRVAAEIALAKTIEIEEVYRDLINQKNGKNK